MKNEENNFEGYLNNTKRTIGIAVNMVVILGAVVLVAKLGKELVGDLKDAGL